MADEWASCHAAIMALVDEIEMFRRVGKAIPETLVTDCEAVVLMVRARHQQYGTMTRLETHRPWILVYVPVGSYPDAAEELLIAAWDALVAKFNQNIELSDTATVGWLESYQAGWETIGGQKCRVLRAPLRARIVKATHFTASEE